MLQPAQEPLSNVSTVSASAPLSLAELIARCQLALQANARLLTLYGHGAAPGARGRIVVTAVLLPPGQALCVLRAQAEPGQSYPSLALQFAAAQIFERELWEQTGLVPQGHPWLKPVRFEGARQGQMATYPFFKVRGADVHEVGVGPIHAGVIEPGHFRFMCHGEKVHHLEIQLGYQHRGVEALLLRRPAHLLTPLVESIVGDSVLAYAWAFHGALEALADRPVRAATLASRAIGLELERLGLHLATLAGLAGDAAFLQPASTYGRLRTVIINASQKVCGNRFGRGWSRPGAAVPLSQAMRRDLHASLSAFLPDLLQIHALVRSSRTLQARLQGVGSVSTLAARELGLSGAVGRASGIAQDLRHALPGAAYAAGAPAAHSETAGDCWARMHQRMAETQASTLWLLQRLADTALELTDTPAPFAALPHEPVWALQPNALCVALVEGARGPVLLALETGAGGQLVHVKVQDVSLANWFGLAMALRGQAISDFPLCNKSFDLSYCGNDL